MTREELDEIRREIGTIRPAFPVLDTPEKQTRALDLLAKALPDPTRRHRVVNAQAAPGQSIPPDKEPPEPTED